MDRPGGLKEQGPSLDLCRIAENPSKTAFPLLGIDSDNGSEFLNETFFRSCQDQQITFTRSRPYRKNDSCFVEQKNYSVVRRAMGYQRCDRDEQVQLLNELYEPLELYTNFFALCAVATRAQVTAIKAGKLVAPEGDRRQPIKSSSLKVKS